MTKDEKIIAFVLSLLACGALLGMHELGFRHGVHYCEAQNHE